MNYQLYICTSCKKMTTTKPNCHKKYYVVNCTKEEYEKQERLEYMRKQIKEDM